MRPLQIRLTLSDRTSIVLPNVVRMGRTDAEVVAGQVGVYNSPDRPRGSGALRAVWGVVEAAQTL